MTTHIQRQRRARQVSRISILSVTLFITACSGKPTTEAAEGHIRILGISSPDYHGALGDPLAGACQTWTLTPHQVGAFFRVSREYSEPPYGQFYQVACGVSGRLSAEGRVWTFAINGGGTATWRNGDTVRHFGCAAPACEALLLLPPDDMAPD